MALVYLTSASCCPWSMSSGETSTRSAFRWDRVRKVVDTTLAVVLSCDDENDDGDNEDDDDDDDERHISGKL